MIAVLFLATRKYRLLDTDTLTTDVPPDFDVNSAGWEDDGFLGYRNSKGEGTFTVFEKRKLGFRKPTEVCLVRSDELSERGTPLWWLTRVEGRV